MADRVFWYQLHVFQICVWVFCTLPCLALVIYFFPKLAVFFAGGPQRSSMAVIKVVVIAVPIVLLFVALLYLALLLGAVLNVLVVRVLIRELRVPEARSLLLQFYSDPRWLYQHPGTKNFPWWISLWGGMGKNPRLNRWAATLTAGMISLVYGADSRPPA
ncbi:MAG: hypothetical protein KGK44_04380 [Gammaproteobacteria bacterium]|nr:hypothetical protein [Gammaproteobacteria bacterium]